MNLNRYRIRCPTALASCAA